MSTFTLETNAAGDARVFEFTSPNVSIGRDRASNFTLDHPTVSRQHAVIVWDGYYKLVVLSRGGLTAIDGQQVGGEVPLYSGSQLMFGQLAFTFRSPHAPARPESSAYGPGQTGAQQPVYAPPGTFEPASVDGMHATQSGIFRDEQKMPSPDATIGFSQITRSGQFPSMQEHEILARKQAAETNSDGLVSWEEIAATADEVPEATDSLANFQRMQKAQEAADAQKSGPSPLLIIFAIVSIGLLAAAFMVGGGVIRDTETKADDPLDKVEPLITWRAGDIDCVGVAQCRAAAIKAYEVGVVMIERQEADITNLYEGFKNLEKAKEYLTKAKIDTPPTEMSRMTALSVKAKADMQALYVRERNNYFAKEDYKDYAKMATSLNRIHAFFPDERLNYHLWASREVLRMKGDNVYPRQNGRY